MKFFSLCLAAASLFVASQASAQVKYDITGTTDETLNGKKIVLALNFTKAPIDSTMVENGKFHFAGQTESPALAILTVDGRRCGVLTIEDGKTVVTINNDEMDVSGTPNNDVLNAFSNIRKEILKSMEAIMEELDNATEARKAELLQQFGKVNASETDLSFDFCKNNANSLAMAYVLRSKSSDFSMEQIKELLALDGPWKSTPEAKSIIEYVARVEASAVGKQFTDFEMNDINGTARHLSDYVGKGKYVLIDFWASWCGPCRREMPNVVKAYAEYKDKGFEIVGISLDKDGDYWKEAVAELGMTWIQLSDLNYWNCSGAKLYAVRAVPATILIDPQGKIIARDLRGEELIAKLAELFK